MAIKTVSHQVTESEAGRVDMLVARQLGMSRAIVRGLIDFGGVSVNGKACDDAGRKVTAGDLVVVRYEPGRRYREKPVERGPRGFSLHYLDEHIVVVEKPAGILSVPSPKGEKNTLIDLIGAYLAQGKKVPASRRPRVTAVHRLDRDTSGILVFARTKEATGALIAQFAAKQPEREYVALVAGRVGPDEGTIRSLLATDKALNQKSARAGSKASESAKPAVTHYKVQKRFKDATQVVVNLETGRRNQIRVHFAELGHPVLGDVRYEKERAKHRSWPYKRLALHARLLGLSHPASGKTMRFTASMPAEFVDFEAKEKSPE